MHVKLVLSRNYFNEAISDLVVQTFSFLNQINRFYAGPAAWYNIIVMQIYT